MRLVFVFCCSLVFWGYFYFLVCDVLIKGRVWLVLKVRKVGFRFIVIIFFDVKESNVDKDRGIFYISINFFFCKEFVYIVDELYLMSFYFFRLFFKSFFEKMNFFYFWDFE